MGSTRSSVARAGPRWLFATIEVCSRLWAGSLLGRRSYRNTKAVLQRRHPPRASRLIGFPLIATDGFEYYFGMIRCLMGHACVYGQVIKTRRNHRVVRVERRLKLGTARRLKRALLESEDSETLNTSFVERLNLTIRTACKAAYDLAQAMKQADQIKVERLSNGCVGSP